METQRTQIYMSNGETVTVDGPPDAISGQLNSAHGSSVVEVGSGAQKARVNPSQVVYLKPQQSDDITF